MTAIEQQQYLNQHATIFIGGLHVNVLITDVKQAYGRTRYEVTPLQGTGRVWVENLTLKEDTL